MKSEVNIAIAYSKRSLFHNKVIRATYLYPYGGLYCIYIPPVKPTKTVQVRGLYRSGYIYK